jgi:hypothetical protein
VVIGDGILRRSVGDKRMNMVINGILQHQSYPPLKYIRAFELIDKQNLTITCWRRVEGTRRLVGMDQNTDASIWVKRRELRCTVDPRRTAVSISDADVQMRERTAGFTEAY